MADILTQGTDKHRRADTTLRATHRSDRLVTGRSAPIQPSTKEGRHLHHVANRLCRQVDYPEHQCRFQWTTNAVAFWDNRAVQHYASSDYWPETRIMQRASIVGPRPAR
jgi:alpha-ketoglutarate-dependent taurine dioxygenase